MSIKTFVCICSLLALAAALPHTALAQAQDSKGESHLSSNGPVPARISSGEDPRRKAGSGETVEQLKTQVEPVKS